MQTLTSTRRNISCVLGIGLIWGGCGRAGGTEVVDANASTDSAEHEFVELSPKPKPKPTCVNLIAGQRIHAGTVCMTIEPRVAMNVIYTTTDGWQLTEAHLAAGDSMLDVPIDNEGNPQIGQFEFESGDITGATSHAFVVPLRNFHLDQSAERCDPVTAHLAAHAILRKRDADGTWQTQTGWGHGERVVERDSWTTLLTLSLECDAQAPLRLETCEAAFAKGDASTCFIGADFDQDGSDDGIDRWGWSSGPLPPGTGAAWPVYVGASECDVDRATRIGSLSVSYGREGNAQIVFDRVGDFVLDEEHLYVGTEPLPRGKDGRLTVAPAGYPIVQQLDDATHTENQVGGLGQDGHLRGLSRGRVWH